MLDVLAIQSLLELFGPSLTSYTFSPSLHPFYVCFVIEVRDDDKGKVDNAEDMLSLVFL